MLAVHGLRRTNGSTTSSISTLLFGAGWACGVAANDRLTCVRLWVRAHSRAAATNTFALIVVQALRAGVATTTATAYALNEATVAGKSTCTEAPAMPWAVASNQMYASS